MSTQQALLRAAALGFCSTFLAFACGGTSISQPGGSGLAGTPAHGGGSGDGGGASNTPLAGLPGSSAGEGNAAGSDSVGGGAGAGGEPCVGLECNVPLCPAGTTSISGKVFDPSGTLPLYNVAVFVPNAPVPELKPELSCDRCGSSAVPSVTTALTDATGSFKLEGAPAGSKVPLVIQIGKWRRQVVLPSVAACADTAVDAELTRLPRNQQEGDIPRIAVALGAADQLECLPRRLGLDDAEFTTNAGTGRIHLYAAPDIGAHPGATHFDASLNGGAELPPSPELWASLATLQQYDLVLLSCEGNTNTNLKPVEARQAMYDYASLGGRVLASHWQNIWFSAGPEKFATIGTWNNRPDPASAGEPIATVVDQSFAKGAAFAKWLIGVGAAPTLGTLTVTDARDNLQAVDPTAAREWLTLQNPNVDPPKTVEYMSFTTPVGAGADQACGRAAYTDVHFSTPPVAAPGDPPPPGFPLNCPSDPITSQERAMIFLLFELSSCLSPADIP